MSSSVPTFRCEIDAAEPRTAAALSAMGKTPELLERDVLPRVRALCDAHRDRLSKCLVLLPRDILHVMAGTPGHYDFAFQEDLCALLRGITEAGWRAHAAQVGADPSWEELRLFAGYAEEEG